MPSLIELFTSDRLMFFRVLNLSKNRLGDKAIASLCNHLHLAPSLQNVSLAQTFIGREDASGQALGRYLRHCRLQVIDLNYNYFQNKGAYELLTGVYDHGYSGPATLTQLDLSWNCLSTPPNAWRLASLLGTIFRDVACLFHVDLSFNHFNASNCQKLQDGLQDNSTLVGLHLLGNAAIVDPFGFVVPIDDRRERMMTLTDRGEEVLARHGGLGSKKTEKKAT